MGNIKDENELEQIDEEYKKLIISNPPVRKKSMKLKTDSHPSVCSRINLALKNPGGTDHSSPILSHSEIIMTYRIIDK